MDGSTLVVAKSALITALQARPALEAVNVSYQSPIKSSDTKNSAGDFDAIWLGDAHDDVHVEIIGGLPLTFDESYQLEVVIQVLRPKSDGTQLAADQRAVALLGEVLGTVAAAPTLGITTFPRCETASGSWKHRTGVLPGGTGHGSRFELQLNVEARLSLS